MKRKPLSAQELEELILHYSSEIRKLNFLLDNAQNTLEELQKQVKKTPAVAEAKPQKEEIPVKEKQPKKRIKPEKKIKVKAEKEAPKRRGRPRKEKVQEVVAVAKPAQEEVVEAPKKRRGRPKKETIAVKPSPKTPKKESKIRTLKDEESKPKGYRLSDWDLFILNTLKKSGKVLVNSELMDKALARVKKEKLDMDEMSLRGKLNRSIHKLSNKRGDLVKVDYPGKGFAYGLPEWADENGKVREEFTMSMN